MCIQHWCDIYQPRWDSGGSWLVYLVQILQTTVAPSADTLARWNSAQVMCLVSVAKLTLKLMVSKYLNALWWSIQYKLHVGIIGGGRGGLKLSDEHWIK